MTITIAVLSWGQHKTLINTLESYCQWGLDRLGDERVIYFQEISEKDREIASRYGYDCIGSDTNVGIAAAYKALVEQSTSESFLFLENDWMLISDPLRIVIEADWMLEKEVDVVRLRHRQIPGEPLWSRQFAGREYTRSTHLLDAVHWRTDEELNQFPEIVTDSFWLHWFFTTAKNANWTNNPTMFKRQWLIDNIIPKISGDIEVNLQEWWEQQKFVVAQGNGLFTHHRIG